MKRIKKVENIFVDKKRDLYLQSLLKTKRVLKNKGRLAHPDSYREVQSTLAHSWNVHRIRSS